MLSLYQDVSTAINGTTTAMRVLVDDAGVIFVLLLFFFDAHKAVILEPFNRNRI
jgi:hypothetical protein